MLHSDSEINLKGVTLTCAPFPSRDRISNINCKVRFLYLVVFCMKIVCLQESCGWKHTAAISGNICFSLKFKCKSIVSDKDFGLSHHNVPFC